MSVGLGETALLVWNIVKWPILLGIAILLIAVLYYATPNVRQPKFRWISLGALIAIVVLALATLGFFFYVSNFGNYNKTYGTIGGMIVLLLWIWIANISLLFGAEFDAEMERGRQLQGGIAAEENLQLPPRDTKASDKKSDKEQQDIEEGRKLREQQNGGSSPGASGPGPPRHRAPSRGGTQDCAEFRPRPRLLDREPRILGGNPRWHFPTCGPSPNWRATGAQRARPLHQVLRGLRSRPGRREHGHREGIELPGLSANPLRPEAWWTRPLQDWLARQLCQYKHLKDKNPDQYAWVARGHCIARAPTANPC